MLTLLLSPSPNSGFVPPKVEIRTSRSPNGQLYLRERGEEIEFAQERRQILDKCFLGMLGASAWWNGLSSAHASTVDPKTGIVLPSVGEIESAVPSKWDDSDNPFESMGSDQFSRLDSTPDSIFYAEPRFVEHVDEQAVKTMTSYISNIALQPGDSVLDLCSSWTSHIDGSAQKKLGLKRVSGLGMNEKELMANSALSDWVVLDLNRGKQPKLPYDDSSFDVVLCQLSIDYLTSPLEVMQEVGRVLKPGGRVAIIFSNRLFIQKAVGLWTGADDIDHTYTVASYLRFSGGGFTNIKAEDLSTRKGKGKAQQIIGDPLYVVTAVRS